MSAVQSSVLTWASDAPPTNVVGAAIVTGIATIAAGVLVPHITAIFKKDEPSVPAHQPTFNVYYNPQPPSPPAKTKRPGRRAAWIVAVTIFVVGGFITLSLYVGSITASSNATPIAGSSRVTQSAGTKPPVVVSSGTLKDMAQDFIANYDTAISNSRTVATLETFWVFPADWYNDKGVPDAEVLFRKHLSAPKASTSCEVGDAQITSAIQRAHYIEVISVRPWTDKTTGKAGAVTVNYALRTAESGQPYRIFAVYEPPNQPRVCPQP